MPYWRLFYHLVWGTKEGLPMITPSLEPELYKAIRAKAKALEAYPLELNGIETHVHLIAAVHPKVAVATFVGQVKGASSFHVNHLAGAPGRFDWQRGYGAISISERNLPQAIEYVRDRKQHHAVSQNLFPPLERMDELDEGPDL